VERQAVLEIALFVVPFVKDTHCDLWRKLVVEHHGHLEIVRHIHCQVRLVKGLLHAPLVLELFLWDLPDTLSGEGVFLPNARRNREFENIIFQGLLVDARQGEGVVRPDSVARAKRQFCFFVDCNLDASREMRGDGLHVSKCWNIIGIFKGQIVVLALVIVFLKKGVLHIIILELANKLLVEKLLCQVRLKGVVRVQVALRLAIASRVDKNCLVRARELVGLAARPGHHIHKLELMV